MEKTKDPCFGLRRQEVYSQGCRRLSVRFRNSPLLSCFFISALTPLVNIQEKQSIILHTSWLSAIIKPFCSYAPTRALSRSSQRHVRPVIRNGQAAQTKASRKGWSLVLVFISSFLIAPRPVTAATRANDGATERVCFCQCFINLY